MSRTGSYRRDAWILVSGTPKVRIAPSGGLGVKLCSAWQTVPRRDGYRRRAPVGSAQRVSLCGLYVGVEAEQVRRIVTLLEGGKPRVVVAVSGMHADLTIIAGGQIHVLPPSLWLELRPGAAHPVDLARGVPGGHFPRREHSDVMTRPAVEVRGGRRLHAADRAALVLHPQKRAVRGRALGELD